VDNYALMKKLSKSYRKRQRRFFRKRIAGIQKRVAKARRSERRRLRTRKLVIKPTVITLIAPENFNLTRGDGKRVINFLQEVENEVLVRGKPVRLDFRASKLFYPPGVLLLYAEINRIVSLATITKPVKIVPPVSSRALQVLKQVGLFDLTGDSVNAVATREDVIYWRLASGLSQSGDELKILESIADKVNASDAENVQKSGLWRGISEAVNNAQEHGYSKARDDGFTGLKSVRWWLLTQIRNQTFTAAVCDLGCGYAATLQPQVLEWFRGIFKRLSAVENSDTQAIQAAMEYGRSRTKQTERGRGSRDALDLLEKHGDGDLFMLSNQGYVRYSCKGNQVELKSVTSLDFNIRGTIIWWNLKLRSSA
jgi:hypothetical protein